MKNTPALLLSSLFMTLATVPAAPVALSGTWNFFNPEGLSTLTGQSASGFDFELHHIKGIIRDLATVVDVATIGGPNALGGMVITTVGPHGFVVGDVVVLQGTTEPAYNQIRMVVAHVDSPTVIEIDPVGGSTVGAYVGNSTGGNVGKSSNATGNAVRPRVWQQFAPVEMANVGDAFSWTFDIMLTSSPLLKEFRDAFRIFWGDTSTNTEINANHHLAGGNRDDFVKFRLDNLAFPEVSPGVLDLDDASALGSSGGSWPIKGNHPQPNGDFNLGNANNIGQNRLSATGVRHRCQGSMVRISATEFKILVKWSIVGSSDPVASPPVFPGDSTEVYTLAYDETTGYLDRRAQPSANSPSDAWGAAAGVTRGDTDANPLPAGSCGQIDFIGIMIHEDAPFVGIPQISGSGSDRGVFQVSNLEVATRDLFQEALDASQTEITRTGPTTVNVRWTNIFKNNEPTGAKYYLRRTTTLPDISAESTRLGPFGVNGSGEWNHSDTIDAPAKFWAIEFAPMPFF
jgi:hypothetical protein